MLALGILAALFFSEIKLIKKFQEIVLKLQCIEQKYLRN